MSATGTELFACEGCGRSYRWTPQMAGRRVKCKCGQVMLAPSALSSAPVEEVEDDLYALAGETKVKPKRKLMLPEGSEHCPVCDLPLVIGAKICVHCGHDLITGKSPPKPTAPVDDGTAALKDEPVAPPKPVLTPIPNRRQQANSPVEPPAGASARKRLIQIALVIGAVLLICTAIGLLR